MAATMRTWLYLTCLWLSIATVLGHAVTPVGSPLERRTGSAFSASTSDVALGAARGGPAKVKRVAAGDTEATSAQPDIPMLPGAAPRLAERLAEFETRYAVPEPSAPAPSPFHAFQARAPPRA